MCVNRYTTQQTERTLRSPPAPAPARVLYGRHRRPDTAKHQPHRLSSPAPGELQPPAAMPSAASKACSATSVHSPPSTLPLAASPAGCPLVRRLERAAIAARPACVQPHLISTVSSTATTATTAHIASAPAPASLRAAPPPTLRPPWAHTRRSPRSTNSRVHSTNMNPPSAQPSAPALSDLQLSALQLGHERLLAASLAAPPPRPCRGSRSR